MSRVYLDWNATAPLRAEALAAMVDAMAVVGNPSSVHSEGRAAKLLVEAARRQVAELVGCLPTQVVFTGSATEAAALAVAQKGRHGGRFAALATEHDCLWDWSEADLPSLQGRDGRGDAALWAGVAPGGLVAVSAANSETGILADLPEAEGTAFVQDLTQRAGKMDIVWQGRKPAYAILSGHKLGGPKGVGALINFTRDDPEAILKGGGQEMGRRSGTENVIGIAGFGAAAAAAQRDLAEGVWERVSGIRNILEKTLEAGAKETIFVGKSVARLPNTSCFISPGWKGETQVMQMDLAGFAISAGSACSSGKVKASRVLKAMGFAEDEAACAVRVSIGPLTTEEDVLRFSEAWLKQYDKRAGRG